ncbi:MAG TPA: AAA family ATPase [Acidimicrobiales bacterium]|nr:AAA family ATPase [Acidimicrobiales bacterium]
MAALDDAVEAFVEGVTPLVEALAAAVEGVRSDRLRADVVVEAFNLACAFVDADGLHTDPELWALAATFGHRMDTEIGRSQPADIRDSGLLTGRKAWLDEPSALLGVLADADAREGGTRGLLYARLGSQVGHVVAALDLVPSRTELLAVDRFRTTVHQALSGSREKVGAPAGGPPPGGWPAAAVGTVATGDAATAAATAAEKERPPPRPIEELLAKLDALLGLEAVKREVRLVANLLRVEQIRRERDLPVLEQSRHLVFTGNPGTGKTTVARLLAEIYRTLGVVSRGHLVETDRSGLVAGFVGQTAPRVVAAFDRADEGVLLVDEAYSLARGGESDFGREAIDTIVKLVEDRRDRLVVILAGYPDEMAGLVSANPGMKSRFPRTIHFPDYDDDELLAILQSLGEKGRYHLDDGARAAARAFFAAQPRDRGFGNGRLARNLFESAVAHQASRLVEVESPTDEQLTTLTASDITGPAGQEGRA